jgi:type IX secretion system PorP/SprF family membrane protein
MLTVVVSMYGTLIEAQSDFDLSQRWFNESIYNPGATGNSFSSGVYFHSRMQWVGTDGAPVTNVVSVDSYAENINSAFGLAVYTDKIGYLSSWSAKVAYAYNIYIGENAALSLGLAGYLQNRNSHVTPDMLDRSDDPVLSYSKISEYSPNFDFGLEFRGPFKLGASVRHLIKQEMPNSFFPASSMNFWTYISSRFDLSDRIGLEPAVSYMYRDNIGRMEGGAVFYFFKQDGNTHNDKFWIGGMYRLNRQFAMLLGISLTPKIRLGYSFDYGLGDLAPISKMGTHEFFLSWHFRSIISYRDEICPAYRSSRSYRKR